VLAFAATTMIATAATNVTKYLFVPGHGLTAKSGDWKNTTTEELINECHKTGPWMQFVEREYFWGDLQKDWPANESGIIKGKDANGKPMGISKIIADAKLCADAKPKLKLRVMLMHKFADLPRFLTYPSDTENDGNLATVTKRAPKPTTPQDPPEGTPLEYNIKLDNSTVLSHLQKLYKAVIEEFKKPENEDARNAFYGFVIQEHAFGNSDYWNDATRDAWVTNLIAFHTWLAKDDQLLNFAPSTSTPHRLFWQMINSPATDAARIAASLPDGAGLDGPDTFPLEPAPQPDDNPDEPNAPKVALYKTYNTMREYRKKRPLALHVYALNYWNPYLHANKEVTFVGDDLPTLAPQLPWGRDPNRGINNAGTIGSYWEAGLGDPMQNNGWAGTGIANFLGCVAPWAKTKESYNPNETLEIDNLNVNNVVWAYATFVPDEAKKQGYPDSAKYGWADFRTWMMNTPSQFPCGDPAVLTDGDPAGGCTKTIPIRINTNTVP